MTRSLFLVGARGVGKSTVAAALAHRLGVAFVDADDLVMERAGKPVRLIFQHDGEAEFRRWEKLVMVELLSGSGCVVATGGGCVVDEELWGRLRASQAVVWLRAAADVVNTRLVGSERPALTRLSAAAETQQLHRERTPLYDTCSRWQVDTDARTVQEVVHVLEHIWQELQGHQLW